MLLQVLLRNPLADPYILGVSGGAAVGALLAMLLGWGLVLTNLSSLAGALTAIAIVFGLSFRAGGWNLYRLLLTGVVLSAGCGALTTLILTLAPASDVKGMLFWLMGDVSRAEEVLPAWVTLCVITAVSMLFSRSLNVLGLGQLKAQTLGVAVLPLQVGIYFCASLATVAALMLAGAIGFVGLIVPHAVRLLGVNDFRWLLPLSILLGRQFPYLGGHPGSHIVGAPATACRRIDRIAGRTRCCCCCCREDPDCRHCLVQRGIKDSVAGHYAA